LKSADKLRETTLESQLFLFRVLFISLGHQGLIVNSEEIYP